MSHLCRVVSSRSELALTILPLQTSSIPGFSHKTDSSVWTGLPEMSSDRDQGRAPSPRAYYQASNGTGGAVGPLAVSTDFDQSRNPMTGRNPYSAPPSSTAAIPGRSPLPIRSSTTGSSDPDRNLSANMNPVPKARSEDLNP